MQHVKKVYLIMLLACACAACLSQPKIKPFTDSINPFPYEAFHGDTVLVGCDTIVMMRKAFFLNYQKNFHQLRSAGASFRDVVHNYEETFRLQSAMLTRQEGYYQELKSKLDSLSHTSLSLADRTSNNITVISTSLNNATGVPVTAQALLKESEKLLAEERRRNLRQKLKIGIGSFGVGVGVTALLLLLGGNN